MKNSLSILLFFIAINGASAKSINSTLKAKANFMAICGRWHDIVQDGKVVGRERVCLSIKHGKYVDTQSYQ